MNLFWDSTISVSTLFAVSTGSSISGCTCCHHNNSGWILIRTNYINELAHKNISALTWKIRKNTNSKGAMTSLQHLRRIISL